MNVAKLKEILSDCCHDISFSINGVIAGVTSEVRNYKPTWQAWYGKVTKTYSKVDDLLEDALFGGYSLNDIAQNVTFNVL